MHRASLAVSHLTITIFKLLDFVLERHNPYYVRVTVPVPLHELLVKVIVE